MQHLMTSPDLSRWLTDLQASRGQACTDEPRGSPSEPPKNGRQQKNPSLAEDAALFRLLSQDAKPGHPVFNGGQLVQCFSASRHCWKMNIDRVLLGVVAFATSAIALKMWLTPAPVTYAELAKLGEAERLPGADREALQKRRAELLQRIPYVRLQ